MELDSREFKEVDPVNFDEWLKVLKQEHIGIMCDFFFFFSFLVEELGWILFLCNAVILEE